MATFLQCILQSMLQAYAETQEHPRHAGTSVQDLSQQACNFSGSLSAVPERQRQIVQVSLTMP